MQSTLHTEQEWLKMLSKGDSATIKRIYTVHYRMISSWILKHNGSEQDAADICQESVVVLYEKSKSGDFQLTSKISTYLFSVAKNLWYKELSKRGQEIYTDEQIEQESNYEEDLKVHHEREVHYQHLDEALVKLGSPCNELLKAYYYKHKNMQELTDQFGYTNADTAKTQKYKCLTRLKKIFFEDSLK